MDSQSVNFRYGEHPQNLGTPNVTVARGALALW